MKMKNIDMKKFAMKNPLEIILLVLIVIYLFYPAPTPQYISSALDTPLGVVILIIVILFLFLYCHILLGILFILVAYKLLISAAPGNVAVIEYTPIRNEEAKDQDTIILPNVLVDANKTDLRFQQRGYGNQMAVRTSSTMMNNQDTLELNIVQQMAAPKMVQQDYLDSEFKPVAESVHNANGV
jgi:predicted membrane protein